MKKLIKSLLKKLILLLPLRKVILLESVPDFSDNTKAVYDELIKRGVNKKYKIIWIVSPSFKIKHQTKNVKFIHKQGKLSNIKLRYYNLVSKCIICCNGFIVSKRKNQFSIYLSHGTSIKSVRNYYNIPNGIDCCLVAGQGVKDLMSYELKYDINKIVALGFPRNDVLCKKLTLPKGIFEREYDKVIVWYPTFRQHKGGSKTASQITIPILNDVKKAKILNSLASKNNVLIVLKPHFAQDVSYIKDLGLSNIRFIDDRFFVENNISSYEFVGGCDALISDYSSIYYDYTFCDKPIAVVWEDIEDYKQNPGLIENYEHYLQGAEKVYTIDELMSFVERVAKGEDVLMKERRYIRDLCNYSNDGGNSKRVVDYILEKINYKE